MARLLEIWRLLNAPCEEMTALASQSFDRELDFWPRFAFRLHLLYCYACRRYLRQLRLLRETLGRLRQSLQQDRPPAGPALSPAARQRIRAALERR